MLDYWFFWLQEEDIEAKEDKAREVIHDNVCDDSTELPPLPQRQRPGEAIHKLFDN